MMRRRGLGDDFDQFVRDSSNSLLRFAGLLIGDWAEAEDLLQVALLRTATHWSAARGAPAAYTRRVLINLSTDRWRNKSRRPREVYNLATPDRGLDSAERSITERDELLRLIGQLSIQSRQVLVLRYFEDLSVAQTASLLGCDEGTVKSRSSRALAALRELLAASTDANILDTSGPKSSLIARET